MFGKFGGRWSTLERREERSEVTASSVFAACMTGTDWSFSLRSATGFFNDADSDEDDEQNVGDAGTFSLLSSSSSHILQQIDLAAREDSAQYKPNPWSIARVNAASRSRQPNSAVKPVPENAAAKKPPQGAIVDAFKRQAQKPKTTTNSSTQANRRQTPTQKPTSTPAIDASDNLVTDPARSSAPIAHITTSTIDPVPAPSQPPTPQQHQETQFPSFLPRRVFPAPHSSKPNYRSPNPCFTPNLKPVQPHSSPAPPPLRSQHYDPDISKPRPTPPQAPPQFGPHTLNPRTSTPTRAHLFIDHLAPVTSAYLSRADHPTPAKAERKTPIIKVSPKSETIPPSPSFAQARRFFEQNSLPVNVIRQPPPESEPLLKEESRPLLPSSRPRTTSPPRKSIDPYNQLPPSPDSEWSTLKPPTRKANRMGKPKTSDLKSGKFRLPLSLGTIAPKEPPQKKPRVITYLPPPPPKKQKTVAEPHLRTQDAETAFPNSRPRTSGILSPPPSDETAPPSSPTPSVQFDPNAIDMTSKVCITY
ncbi:hypothetical protein BDM02DRAFT_2598907 [Thelephora ganbajun]|uniref:Uncharacterized protein n=1 Tax=Thelephora ganbajun TaxID=370292 RepID=A0ACB6ZT22_THEGA|nr:hypothetical protein BDM02DRAFT_2598907 [Thelephora ganbajun]